MTSRVSVSSAGAEANGWSRVYGISTDGQWVVFQSVASNLIANNTNLFDIYVHNRVTGVTQLVNVSSAGVQANSACEEPSISDSGRYVVFHSFADNLVVGDTPGSGDVFLRDLNQGTTIRVSQTLQGATPNGRNENGEVSSDGNYVAFDSFATDLILNDVNGYPDVVLASAGGLYPYGNVCAGSGGFVPVLFSNGSPTPDNTVVFSIQNGLDGAMAYVCLGYSQAQIPLGSGCDQFIDPLSPNPIAIALNGIGPGNGWYDLPVYLDLNTAPGTLTLQALVSDPAAANGFFAVSQGLEFRVP